MRCAKIQTCLSMSFHFLQARLPLDLTIVVNQHEKSKMPQDESTIMLRESSQGESSVMRVRLEGCKKKTYYKYALVEQICISWKRIRISRK